MPGTTGFCSSVLERDVRAQRWASCGHASTAVAGTLLRRGRAALGGVLARGEGGRSGRSRAGPRAPRPRCGLWDLGPAPEPLCASVPSGVDGATVRVAVPRGEPDATPPQADVPRAGARGGPRGGQLRSRSGRTVSPRGLADLRGGTSPRSARRPCPARPPGPRLGAQGQVCFPGPAVLLRRWTSRKGWPSVAPAEPEDRAGRPGQATRTGARAGARRCVCLRRHRRHIRGGCFAISEKRFLPLQEGSGPGLPLLLRKCRDRTLFLLLHPGGSAGAVVPSHVAVCGSPCGSPGRCGQRASFPCGHLPPADRPGGLGFRGTPAGSRGR